ncbi:hypothetical protein NL676_029768 [Syzygium grande]|nr:hypothetical protein NL676_029768 [Syzygium grande]
MVGRAPLGAVARRAPTRRRNPAGRGRQGAGSPPGVWRRGASVDGGACDVIDDVSKTVGNRHADVMMTSSRRLATNRGERRPDPIGDPIQTLTRPVNQADPRPDPRLTRPATGQRSTGRTGWAGSEAP